MALSSFAAVSVDSLDQEVRALVELVRLSRVTVLIAEDGSDKSTVLRSMVMPLLQGDGSGSSREIAVLFDWWKKAPLRVLTARIDEALARVVGDAAYAVEDPPSADRLSARLAERERTFDCKFVIILDRFEEFLAAAPDSDESREFEAQFVEAVNSPKIHANFVLSLDERAARGLARLQERIPGLGDAQVRLSKVVPERASPASAQPEAPADRLVGSPAPLATTVVDHERHDEIGSPATESETASAVTADAPQKGSWTRAATALVVALLIVSSLALLGIRRAGESEPAPSAAAGVSPSAGASTDAQREQQETAPAETPSPVTSPPEAARAKDAPPEQAPPEKPPPSAASSSATMAIPPPAASASEASGPLLYIIIGNEAQREYAERIIAPLVHRGINVAGIRVAHAGPPVSDLRYFHSADRGEAATINRALDVIGRPAQRLRYVPGFEHQAPPKNYELWLPAR